MKIYFLGTCSGTEPMEGMHQCSLIMEVGEHFYWFDAGECCGYTAHTMGLDICKARALFISHPHPDHIGGLLHLFFCFDKLNRIKGTPLVHNNTLELFSACPEIIEMIAKASVAPNRQLRFQLNNNEVKDGLVYQDENLRVTAIHNGHLREDGSKGWHSYSYLVEAEGKRVIFSGDVRSPLELDPLIGDHCDLLIMETGHHKVEDVCRFAVERPIDRLRFNHHGREIIADREKNVALTKEFMKERDISICICHDRMVEEL